MLPVSRPARSTVIARIFLAVMLALVLLSGVIPLSSFASSHECGMACCAGKPSHMAGSCSTALDDEAEDDSAHNHEAHASGATSAKVSSVKHHGAAKQNSAHHSTSGAEESRQSASVASEVMTSPCAPECAAAALGYSQVRRPRDAASTTSAARPHAPALCFLAGHLSEPLSESAEKRSQARPRAPPTLLINLSA